MELRRSGNQEGWYDPDTLDMSFGSCINDIISACLSFGFAYQNIQGDAKCFVDEPDLVEGEAALAGENLTCP